MKQYENSGPPQEKKPGVDKDPTTQLKEQISAQSARIDFLEREIRRLKSRVDDAVAVINRRNG